MVNSWLFPIFSKFLINDVNQLVLHLVFTLGYERNFRKESKDTIDSLGVPYDYDSVMHYGAFFFGKKRGAKTIETKKKASIGQRVGLSDMDLKQAKLLYKCGGKVP